MTMRVHMQLTADSSDLTAEMRKAQNEITRLGESQRQTNAAVARESDAGVVVLQDFRRGLEASSRSGTVYGRTIEASAAHTANLTAQLNDIGVMLAAGQSPLQLAVQQGTQINQVFAMLGGGMNALRAMGSAFVGMINPMSLATIAVIGFGAAGVQWLMSLGGEAEDLEDRLDDLSDAMSVAKDVSDMLGTSQLELRKRYAGTAEEVSTLRRALTDLALNDLNAQISGAAEGALGGISEQMRTIQREATEMAGRMAAMGRSFDGFSIEHVAERLGTSVEFAELATAALERFNSAASSEERNQALLQTLRELEAMREQLGELPPAAQALYDELVPAAAKVSEATALAGQLEDGMHGAAGAIDTAADAASRVADELARAATNAMTMASQSANALREAEIRFANRGNPVAEAGALAAHRFDSRVGDFSGADPILREALTAQRAEAIRNAEAAAQSQEALREWNRAEANARRGGRSAATKDTRDEAARRERAEGLGRGIRDEIDALRELDPLKQEMIRWRERLRDLTPQEAEEISGLVTELHREKAALEEVIDQLDAMRGLGKGAVGDLVSGLREASSAGEALGSVLEGIGKRLMDIGTNAIGDVLFGKSGSQDSGLIGGAISGILGAILPFAKGGVVNGATLFAHTGGLGVMGEAGPEAILPLSGGGVGAMMGGREMRLPLTRLASGELGVEVEPFARGGVFGQGSGPLRGGARRGPAMAGSEATAGKLALELMLSPDLEARLLETAGSEVDLKLRRATREMDNQLPRRIKQISNDPSFMGRKR